jgi:hypothetical protein
MTTEQFERFCVTHWGWLKRKGRQFVPESLLDDWIARVLDRARQPWNDKKSQRRWKHFYEFAYHEGALRKLLEKHAFDRAAADVSRDLGQAGRSVREAYRATQREKFRREPLPTESSETEPGWGEETSPIGYTSPWEIGNVSAYEGEDEGTAWKRRRASEVEANPFGDTKREREGGRFRGPTSHTLPDAAHCANSLHAAGEYESLDGRRMPRCRSCRESVSQELCFLALKWANQAAQTQWRSATKRQKPETPTEVVLFGLPAATPSDEERREYAVLDLMLTESPYAPALKHYLEGGSMEQAAKIVGLTRETFRRRLKSEARRLWARRHADLGISDHPTILGFHLSTHDLGEVDSVAAVRRRERAQQSELEES